LDMLSLARPTHDLRSVPVTELPQPNENSAAILRGRDMRRPRRIAEIGPGRVIAMLVLKDTFQNQNFFATTVRMTREGPAASIAHDRCGTRDLAANAKQHAPINAGRRTGDPIDFRGMNEDWL